MQRTDKFENVFTAGRNTTTWIREAKQCTEQLPEDALCTVDVSKWRNTFQCIASCMKGGFYLEFYSASSASRR
jgi:hypothetical protein